jgi:hypothetical protein
MRNLRITFYVLRFTPSLTEIRRKFKNPSKSFLPAVLFLFLAFFLAGCFEYEETITIRKDGSGEMAVHYFGPSDSDLDVDGFKLNAKEEREMREHIERKFSRPGLRLKNYQWDSSIRGKIMMLHFFPKLQIIKRNCHVSTLHCIGRFFDLSMQPTSI